MISAREAAEIARKRGLSLTDAAALSRLADSPEEADELAKEFAEPPRPSQLSRADLAGLKPEEIEAARIEGRLADVMGYTP